MSTTGPLGTQTPDLVVQGTITTAGGTSDPSSMVQVIGGEGASTWVADLRGTFSAGTTIVFEATANSQDWFAVAGMLEGSTSPTLVTFVAGPGPAVYTGSFAGNLGFRVRATSIAGSDAVIATLRLSTGVLAGFSSGGGGGGGTVNQGTPNTLANAWPVEMTDGTNGPVAVKPSGQAATGTDPAAVVTVSPNSVALPLSTGAATNTNQATEIANLQALNSLVPSVYDYISLSYTGTNLTTVVYMVGGSGGTVVSTLTLAYTGSNLTSVTKS